MENSKEALVIVAHPDDETIWMGGVILKNNDWSWTILSLCRKDDEDRWPKFLKVCKIYNAYGIISDLDDEELLPIPISEIIDKINKTLPNKEYDYIFTHGENGEYGHIRHLEIHNAVEQMINSGELNCEKSYYFSYTKGENSPQPNLRTPKPNKDADFIVELTDEEHNKKKEIVRDVYGYPNENGFELLSCNKMETFSEK